MQIKKTYKDISPDLLYSEIRDFTLKQGVTIGESKMETYTLPDQSSDFITRATLTFLTRGEGEGNRGKECLRAHMVGSARTETKLLLDVDEKLFPADRLAALQSDLDFIFSGYEVKQG
jgi:hypothetical protein